MRYFIDTEFREIPGTIDLISIGIVAQDGRELYLLNKDVNLKEVWGDKWLKDNVLTNIYTENIHGDARNRNSFSYVTLKDIFRSKGKTTKQLRSEILKFVGDDDDIEFYGYYSDYDWVVFCWIFGRMIDLPKGFPKYCRDLKQTAEELGLDREWIKSVCPVDGNEHSALADAKWNMKLFKLISKQKDSIEYHKGQSF